MENQTFDTEVELVFIIVESQSKWQVKTNFPEADFWLINKGNKSKLGEPVKEFQPYLVGLKCPDYILPQYAYYFCLNLFQSSFWQQYALGSINLNHLRIKDIKSVFNQMIPSEGIVELHFDKLSAPQYIKV